MNTLEKKIMRRIYYAYALRVTTQPAVLHGFFMLAMLTSLTYFVSIGNVINNMMNVQVSHLDTFVYNAITNTEAWTLVIIGALIFSLFSLRFTLAPAKKQQLGYVRA